MTGIILCGGQSSRMGRDKGLLISDRDAWARSAYEKLAGIGVPTKISVNAKQYASYSTLFHPADLIIDDDSLVLKGPLLGVLSTHLHHPSDDLFVLACDMPLMETFLLKELLTASQTHAAADAFVFSHNGEPEPLCAIYRCSVLAGVVSLLHSHQLPRHSMKFLLDHINVFSIPLLPEHTASFRNFNSHAELNGM